MNPINVTRSSMPGFDEYCDEIRELWDSRWLTNSGAKHQQFERDLQTYLGTQNVTLYCNGHLALEHLLTALDFPQGSEVITTPFTFASTTHAIVRAGLQPVMCDVDPVYYTLDPACLPALVTEKTVAILPVHVYGNLCDVDGIAAFAAAHGLKVIYDAAHAFGVTRGGVSAANFGDAAMFSFHATKVFHSIEGGMLSYRDGAIAQKLGSLKNFGITGTDAVGLVGGNAKMNEFSAAMGICNLRHLDDQIAKRGAAAARYRERLGNVPGIRLCPPQADTTPNYAYFPVVFDGYTATRDEIFTRLAAGGITARKYFYPLTSTFDCYRAQPFYGAQATPVAARIAQQVLTLPLYADLTAADVDRICDVILEETI